MRTLPEEMIRVLEPFAPLFSGCVWQHAQVLLAGTILAPGRRTVSSALRAMGLDQERRWQMETTFQEVQGPLGFETQRNWSERAIIRKTAPAHC
jgi:hypothetical protein